METTKYPHKTFVLKGAINNNIITLKKVLFKNKLFSNFFFKEKKNIIFLSIGTKWFKYKNKFENFYTIFKYSNGVLTKIFKNEKKVLNRPSIIKIGKKYFMFFCARKRMISEITSRMAKIYASFSNNLIKWSKPNKIKFSKKATRVGILKCKPTLMYLNLEIS